MDADATCRSLTGQPSGFWQLDVPSSAGLRAADIPPPLYLGGSGGDVYALVAGGRTRGRADPSLLVALNNTHILYQSDVATSGELKAFALPAAYAAPLTLRYDLKTHQPIIGPVSHGRTVALAVSRADSSLIAVTGRPDVLTNLGDESIWLTRDAGASWHNCTGDLIKATGTTAKARPSALLIMDLGGEAFDGRSGGAHATTVLLVGTVSGVYLSWVDDARLGQWSRLGTCAELPLVLTLGLSYEPRSDTLVAATFGRGVYVMHGATKALLDACKP